MPVAGVIEPPSSLGIARLRPVNGSGVRAWMLFVKIEGIRLEMFGVAEGLDPNRMYVSMVSNMTETKVSNTGLSDRPNKPKGNTFVGVWLVDANGTGFLFANLDLEKVSLDSLPINTVPICLANCRRLVACGRVRKKL